MYLLISSLCHPRIASSVTSHCNHTHGHQPVRPSNGLLVLPLSNRYIVQFLPFAILLQYTDLQDWPGITVAFTKCAIACPWGISRCDHSMMVGLKCPCQCIQRGPHCSKDRSTCEGGSRPLSASLSVRVGPTARRFCKLALRYRDITLAQGLPKGEAGRDAEVERVCKRGVQDRRPTRDAHRSAARRWFRVVGARTGTSRAIAIGAWWDDKGRALSLAALNPFAGDAVLGQVD
jgi:hypothetical protein